jgi:uncharacterized protein (DUF2225 family)
MCFSIINECFLVFLSIAGKGERDRARSQAVLRGRRMVAVMIGISPGTVTERELSLGDIVVKEGDASKEMVVVLKGNVGVYKDYKGKNEVCVNVMTQGGYYGEQSLFAGREQSNTIVALTEAAVFVINPENLKEFLRVHTDLAVTIFEDVCKRFAEASAILEKQQRLERNTEVASGKSPLFPEGHGSYILPLTNENEKLVFCVKATCPLCGQTFDNLGIFASRLRQKNTEADSRVRYDGVEPLYYEITTCPNCLFSADFRSFAETSKKAADAVGKKVAVYKLETQIKTGRDRDTFTVFAGYFLALLCSQALYPSDYQLTAGSLWHKISRLYSDCNDEKMEQFAAQQAFDNFNHAYSNLFITESQSQQICYSMGELSFKLGNIDAAKNYFFTIKTNPNATPLMKRKADQRIYELREMTRLSGAGTDDGESKAKKGKK